MIGTSAIKESRRSSLVILRKFALTCCKAEFAFFFLSLGVIPRIFTIYRKAEYGEAISLYPLHHFHLLPRLLDISQVVAADS